MINDAISVTRVEHLEVIRQRNRLEAQLTTYRGALERIRDLPHESTCSGCVVAHAFAHRALREANQVPAFDSEADPR